MEDKIENSIALHQQTINELNELKEKIETNQSKKVRFKIETKHWYGYSEPFLAKDKDIVDLSKYTMQVVLDEAIKNERKRIDKLIDMEIEKRSENSK